MLWKWTNHSLLSADFLHESHSSNPIGGGDSDNKFMFLVHEIGTVFKKKNFCYCSVLKFQTSTSKRKQKQFNG